MSQTNIEGGAKFCIELKIAAEEFATWEPERIASFFDGVAKVVAATKGDLSLPAGNDKSPEVLNDVTR